MTFPQPRRRLSRDERGDVRWRRRRSDPLLHRLAWELVDARRRAGLTQQQVADRMRTTRSAISRLESGVGHRPTLNTLDSYAQVVGHHVEIHIRPGL